MTMGLTARLVPGAFGANLVCFLLFCVPWGSAVPAPGQAQEPLEILDISSPKGDVGKDSTLSCSVLPEDAELVWLFNDQPVKTDNRIKEIVEKKVLPIKDQDGNPRKFKVSNLTIANATSSDAGNYTCVVTSGKEKVEKVMVLDLSFSAKLISKTKGPIDQKLTDQANITLKCVFEIYKPQDVKWLKKVKDDDIFELQSSRPKQIGLREVESTYDLRIHSPDDNGTYICQIYDEVTSTNYYGEVDIRIYALPQVVIDKVIPISSSQLFLNWTVKAYNSKIKGYNIMYRAAEPASDFQQYTREKIGVENTSFVMNGLEKSTKYQLKLEVNTEFGPSKQYFYNQTKKTLEKDPIFTPNISINGFSATSVTIGWAPPPEDIAELIHYYLLEARKKDEATPRRAYHSRDGRNLPYMFDNLEPHSTYVFRVCACSDFTKACGNWSIEMPADTLDGTPGKPSNVTVFCTVREINVTWEPPLKPNAVIKTYAIEVTGKAMYKDTYGITKEAIFGPKSKFCDSTNKEEEKRKSYRMDSLLPNTNYTVRLSAMTRSRRKGEEEVRYCTTKTAPPDNPPRPTWKKIYDGKYMFKMYLPRVSERNGPICCYRVYMVRIPPNFDWNSLPSPKDIPAIKYDEAHLVQPMLGAYMTDVFSNNKFPTDEIIMGDDRTYFYKEDPTFAKDECLRCLKKSLRAYHDLPIPKLTTNAPTATTTDDLFEDDVTTGDPEEKEERSRRSPQENEPDYMLNPVMMDTQAETDKEVIVTVEDGLLDSEASYTMFVELMPGQPEDDPLYSEYLNVLSPTATPVPPAPSSVLEVALQATCAVAALLLVCSVIFCILQSRKTRKLPHNAHLELNPIHAALRYVVGQMGGRQQAAAGCPPDMPPIAREDLAAAYAEKQADSDYGFQKEFELLQMLPECFPDRTTHASEARENQPKNRYPDIKAYDQTRVKLSQIDGISGSDYINANYVMGYKESKQFICAQGPTETTVNDFWRMIWEHGLELIVMLTNLEEYSKVKCSKYWPDEVKGTRAFGGITVHHVSEKRYSDYTVRELRITKQAVTTEGQPIVENNGVAKRNGDISNGSESSAPTSPRDRKDSDTESRIVRQYHFLMWKDFAAPEYPHSILKFIKRVNEAWLCIMSRPVVVHCSAGVGRTGTLVALDYLLSQLRTTDHAAVFNCVAELRRQRNFLVQSLKQYIFVYRALVEYAHYGDTEIPASRLKTTIDRLRNTPEGAFQSLMEVEFEKMLNSPVSEPVKSTAAGAAEELRAKNRSQDCLPYDRNRVILPPIPGREFSTYINASFIEAYDNSESFIITQDPLPTTILDFWRMVSEHDVSTIVMLSEVGEGKCPRYWDDGTAQYEHISVEYEESESCPYYTRRQFKVVNNKSGAVSSVRQLQYQGWPTAAGHVPEVTRGLAELAAAAPPLHHHHRMLVHCSLGTERSALFVALCILISQLRTEKRVDVNVVARKIRSQRAHTIDTMVQYEFLHRAILNYAELHNLLEDS